MALKSDKPSTTYNESKSQLDSSESEPPIDSLANKDWLRAT